MKIYLAVLKENVDLDSLKEELKKKEVKFLDHFEAVGIVKLESAKPVSEADFEDYFESLEEERDNFAI